VQCHLPKNRPPRPAEVEHCWKAHVEPWLTGLAALRVIVAIGQPAARKLVGPRAKQSTVGTTHLDGTRYVVPIVHPAAVVRGQWAHDPAQPKFLRRAWEIACADSPPNVADVGTAPPGGTIARTLADVSAWIGDVLAARATVACDIEGTGGVLIGIGFCRLDTLASMYVPFRNRAAPYWPDREVTRAVAYWVDRVLSEPTVGKVFHNGSSFDVPFLEGIGFEVAGYVDDTMIRAWATYHEAAKDLQSLGILYAGLPAWKHLSHVGDEGEGK
jgi:hypothetical protein